METLVYILIVGDDKDFVKEVENAVHSKVVTAESLVVPEDIHYDFYVLGFNPTEAMNTIRQFHDDSPVYLFGSACDQNIPIRQICKCHIAGCLENEKDIQNFAKQVDSLYKQKIKMHEASCKLDHLRSGDLKALTKQLKKVDSERFVDYIQNHTLPMLLINNELEILHANCAMEKLIGTKLAGVRISTFWTDLNRLDQLISDLKKEGQLLGAEVTLKNINGKVLNMKLYTSIHLDKKGNWLNTRCLLVPTEQTLPE